MENKKTSELLDLLWRLENEENPDWDEVGDVRAELEKRPPFNDIIGVKDDKNDWTHAERLDSLDEDMKLIKRHKHDEKSGDVMVRI